MLEVATFAFEKADGEIGCLAGRSLVPLLAMAEKSRKTGVVGKERILRGIVNASWRQDIPYHFVAESVPVAKHPKAMAKG